MAYGGGGGGSPLPTRAWNDTRSLHVCKECTCDTLDIGPEVTLELSANNNNICQTSRSNLSICIILWRAHATWSNTPLTRAVDWYRVKRQMSDATIQRVIGCSDSDVSTHRAYAVASRRESSGACPTLRSKSNSRRRTRAAPRTSTRG